MTNEEMEIIKRMIEDATSSKKEDTDKPTLPEKTESDKTDDGLYTMAVGYEFKEVKN